MELQELEALLGIIIVGTPQEAAYAVKLAAAEQQALDYTKRTELPAGASMGVAMLVKALGENPGVASQSLGSMSKSFFEGGSYKAALNYLRPYKRIRVI
jgi:hypothetical protein